MRTRHLKADRDSLYVKCKEGGRCLFQIEGIQKRRDKQYCRISEHKNKESQCVSTVKIQESNKPIKNLTTTITTKIVKELDQTNEMNDTDKEGMQHTKAKLGVFLQKKCRSKEMLGQYIRSIDRQLISEDDVFVLLSNGVTTAETVSEILTANDQALQQKFHATKILQTALDNKCKTFKKQHNTLYQHAKYW